jgi:NADH:ubiquinone oxidoreductase subunit K
MPPSSWYLYVAAALFCIGLFGVITRRNTIAILMSIELMLNAANLNLVTVAAYRDLLSGQIFALFVMTIAAAEASVGLAIVINVYRTAGHIDADGINIMKW